MKDTIDTLYRNFFSLNSYFAIIYAVINGYLKDVEVSKVSEYEQRLYSKLKSQYSELLDRFEAGYFEDSDVEQLRTVLDGMQG